MTPPRWTGGSDADCRGEVDRRPRSQAAGIMDGMDRRPLPHAPDSGHHEIASDDGGERVAAIYTLTETAKLNGIDPAAWLRHVLGCLATHPAKRISDLLPWNWAAARDHTAIAA